ncbi:MAG TPA: hypothetical protein VLG46_01765 [Anaerolineae bacterium]|nr:hypothetical protein [Anaerolineae bacterium]
MGSEAIEGHAAASPVTPAIELHIEELALHGFPAADRHPIGTAVERELARLLAERGKQSRLTGGEIARLDGGAFAVTPNATPEMIGMQIAQAIYTGLIR